MTATATKSDPISIALVGGLTVIWGSSFFLIAIALQELAPMAVASGRVLLAALALACAARIAGERLPDRRIDWLWCGTLGVVNFAAPFTLLAFGLVHVPSAVASIFIAAVPLFILALSRIVYGDRIGPAKWVGFGLGLGGLVLLAGPAAVADLGNVDQLAGQAALLGAAFCYASGAMIVRAMPPIPSLPALAASHGLAALALLPFGMASLPDRVPALPILAALLMLGVVQTGLAQLMRFVAIRRAGPVFTSTVGYLIPIWAGFLGVAFLGELIGPTAIIAYGLIVGGLLIARPGRARTP